MRVSADGATWISPGTKWTGYQEDMEHQAKGLDRPKTTQVGTWSQTISSEGKKAAYVSLHDFYAQ